MSKLTWHFQKRPEAILSIVNETPAEWVKFIDPPEENPTPGKKVIGRHYIPDGVANDMIMAGAAQEWFDRNLPAFEKAPYVHCWELPNEPPVGSPKQRAALVEFSLDVIWLMHLRGLKTAALCLSVGWPEVGTARDFIPILEKTDFWAMHQYGYHDMRRDSEWYSLRHRKTVEELGVDVPPLLITESGLEPGGWKKFTDHAGYQEQLAWYDDELQKDAYVECATLFTSGPEREWKAFDIDEEMSLWIKDRFPPVNVSATIREQAWNQVGVSYNPDAAFSREARKLGLGAPMTGEFDYDGFRAQGFVGGVLYCEVGHWGEIEFVVW